MTFKMKLKPGRSAASRWPGLPSLLWASTPGIWGLQPLEKYDWWMMIDVWDACFYTAVTWHRDTPWYTWQRRFQPNGPEYRQSLTLELSGPWILSSCGSVLHSEMCVFFFSRSPANWPTRRYKCPKSHVPHVVGILLYDSTTSQHNASRHFLEGPCLATCHGSRLWCSPKAQF